MELIIASQNLHKVREYREMLKAFRWIDVLSLHDFPEYQPTTVSGPCFKENASAKAKQAAIALNKWVIADDSGIVIPALGSSTERNQRFFCGDDKTDTENRLEVLKALQGKSDLHRSAFLECAVAIANAQGVQKVVTGICEGMIVEEQRGRNGYGYDAIFRKHDYDKTFAELDSATKIRVSDRRKAFEKLSLFLETLVS